MLRLKNRRSINASILYEVPEEGRNQGPQIHKNEEWEACHQRHVPEVRNQGIQDRKGLELEQPYYGNNRIKEARYRLEILAFSLLLPTSSISGSMTTFVQ
jgi:hypothetical protein